MTAANVAQHKLKEYSSLDNPSLARILNPWTFPSKWRKSLFWESSNLPNSSTALLEISAVYPSSIGPSTSLPSYVFPCPPLRASSRFLKNLEIATSPKCPKGGFPISCINPAVCRIEGIYPFFFSSILLVLRSSFSTPSPSPLLKQDTSSECVNLVLTKSFFSKGNTCALSCSLLT